MRDVSKAEIWKMIDALGEEVAALSGPAEEAARQAKTMELFQLAYQAVSRPAEKARYTFASCLVWEENQRI